MSISVRSSRLFSPNHIVGGSTVPADRRFRAADVTGAVGRRLVDPDAAEPVEGVRRGPVHVAHRSACRQSGAPWPTASPSSSSGSDVPGLLGTWPPATTWRSPSTDPTAVRTGCLRPAPSTCWWSWVPPSPSPTAPSRGSGRSAAWSATALDDRVPVLGVCFGGQLLAELLGGTVAPSGAIELGWAEVETSDPARVPAGPAQLARGRLHLPPGSRAAGDERDALQAYVEGIHTGVQFHPEVTAGVVGGWIDEARDRSGVSPEEAAALLSGFDADGAGPGIRHHDPVRRLPDQGRRPRSHPTGTPGRRPVPQWGPGRCCAAPSHVVCYQHSIPASANDRSRRNT